MAHDREVAGIRCMQVLEALPDFLEGELSAAQHQRILAHLEGCSWCEQFGGSYAATVALMRDPGLHPEELPGDVEEHLLRRLEELLP